MRDKGTTTARPSLRLRDSPKDGTTLTVLKPGTELEILGRETWLRVRTEKGRIGYVLSDYVEPSIMPQADEEPHARKARIIDYEPTTRRLLGERVRIEESFSESMELIERFARECDVKLWITSSFREPYRQINGAIVPPARRSNHHVGHAIDMNIVADDEFFNSGKLADPQKVASNNKVRKFIDKITDESNQLRWGGVWDPKDPVHIDDGLNRRQESVYQAKLESLWGQRYA
jgi:hypothetical protein